jgi:hypothetical protein
VGENGANSISTKDYVGFMLHKKRENKANSKPISERVRVAEAHRHKVDKISLCQRSLFLCALVAMSQFEKTNPIYWWVKMAQIQYQQRIT